MLNCLEQIYDDKTFIMFGPDGEDVGTDGESTGEERVQGGMSDKEGSVAGSNGASEEDDTEES